MKIRIYWNNSNDLFVYIGLLLYIGFSLLSTTFYVQLIPGFVFQTAMLTSVSLLAFYNITHFKGVTKWLSGLITFAILILLTYLSSRTFSHYAISLVVIFLLKDFDFDKLVKFITPIIIGILLFVVLSSKIGIIQDYIEISSSRIRHYLGFRYSLFPSTVMLNIVALYLYDKRDRILYRELFLLGAAVLWIFLQTNSRLTAISSVVLLALGFCIKRFPNFLERIRTLLFLLIPSYIYAAILSYITANQYIFSANWILSLDKFLGGRIYLASKSLSMYGFGLLGRNIQWIGNGLNADGQRSTMSYLYVDNMYIQVLQKYGLLFLIIFLCLMTISMFILYQRKQYLLLSTLILLAFHATIDDLTFNLHYNFFIVFLSLPFTYLKNTENLDTLHSIRMNEM
ncbi:polymerase [Streptococcus suis]|uniref:polymerase n=1 Tax=Streptococcus suis TaxID=1307 RepID=UPI000CF3F08E|nr:polymerase [Streptococcus suis]